MNKCFYCDKNMECMEIEFLGNSIHHHCFDVFLKELVILIKENKKDKECKK